MEHHLSHSPKNPSKDGFLALVVSCGLVFFILVCYYLFFPPPLNTPYEPLPLDTPLSTPKL